MVALERWVDVWGPVMLTITWQAALLGLLALGCERVLRIRAAQVRHRLWWLVLAAPLLLAPARLVLEQTTARVMVAAPQPVARAVDFTRSFAPSSPAAPGLEPAAVAPDASAFRSFDYSWPGVLLAAWLLGCVVVGARLLLGHRSLRRLLAASEAVREGPARELLDDLAQEASVTREIALCSSAGVSAPLLYGLRRAVILVPREWLDSLSSEDLRAVLAHEVAHIKRRDVLGNLLQRLAELPLFFHPAAWLAGRRITLAREELCDAWALRQGADPSSYARSLATAAEHALSQPALGTLGLAESRFTLLRRVEAIMKGNGNSRTHGVVLIALTAAALLAVTALTMVELRGQAGGGGGIQPADLGGGGGVHEGGSLSALAPSASLLEYGLEHLDASLVLGYRVDRAVTDFPDVEDLSTPEATYATIARALARGDRSIWRHLTADPARVAAYPPAGTPAAPVAPEVAERWLGSQIKEVWIYRGGANCAVFAEQQRTSPPGSVHYDVRSLTLVEGQWLNVGNTVTLDLDAARRTFVEACVYDDARREAHREAVEKPETIHRVAGTLFDSIRDADYDYFLNSSNPDVWQEFVDPGYTVKTDRPGWVNWVCTTFRENPIARTELGEVFVDERDRPAFPYRLTLEDGTVLEGELPFQYFPDTDEGCRTGTWTALEGLDWHLSQDETT